MLSDKLFFLVDDIYPQLSRFVQGVTEPDSGGGQRDFLVDKKLLVKTLRDLLMFWKVNFEYW